MKVAVATADGQVSGHFGQAPGFTFAQVNENGVADVEYKANPGGHCQTLPQMMVDNGVKVLIVGGIGAGAVANMQRNGIDVIGSVSGDVNTVLESFRTGTLTGGAVGCDHNHDHGGDDCGHHH